MTNNFVRVPSTKYYEVSQLPDVVEDHNVLTIGYTTVGYAECVEEAEDSMWFQYYVLKEFSDVAA